MKAYNSTNLVEGQIITVLINSIQYFCRVTKLYPQHFSFCVELVDETNIDTPIGVGVVFQDYKLENQAIISIN